MPCFLFHGQNLCPVWLLQAVAVETEIADTSDISFLWVTALTLRDRLRILYIEFKLVEVV